MPIILDQHTDDSARILVYQDLESLDFLIEHTRLTKDELALIEKYKVERRKKDLVIARYLIQQVIPMAEVAYHPSGKPYLKDGEAKISITHSKDIVAVILHDTKAVGLDIEYISPRVERIKHRFLSASELSSAKTTSLLTLYWSAKETLFKLDKKQGLEFDTELALTPSNYKNILNGKIRNDETITVHYSINEDWVMTYAMI